MPLLKHAKKLLQKLSEKAKNEIRFRKKIKELRNDQDNLPATIEEEGLEFADGAEDIFKQGQRGKKKEKRKRLKSSDLINGDQSDSDEYKAYKQLTTRVKTIDESESNKKEPRITIEFASCEEAINTRIKDIEIDAEFVDNLVITSKAPLNLEDSLVENDTEREKRFLELAKEGYEVGSKLCAKYNIPFKRPNDYYTEMIKSDEHMDKTRSLIVNENMAIEASEKIRHNRYNAKFGKRVQAQKLMERQKIKSKNIELIQNAKNKRNIDVFLNKTERGLDETRPKKQPNDRGKGKYSKKKQPPHRKANSKKPSKTRQSFKKRNKKR